MHLVKLVSAAAALSALAVPVLAQGDNSSSDNTPNPTDVSPETPSANSADQASVTPSPAPSPSPSPSESSNDASREGDSTPSAADSSTTSSSTSSSKSSSSSSSSAAKSTSASPSPTPSPSQASSTTSTSSSTSDSFRIPTGLPTLTGNRGIPTYPPASVPPTKNAPFMRQSSAPSGTVFIAVGAILGAFGIALLVWRAVISFLLHRSVDRAAMAQHDAASKAGFPLPPAPFYKDADGASPPAGNAAAAAAAARRSSRRPSRAPGVVPPAAQSSTNLFFSPTAAGTPGQGGLRGSTFLPSGFYNAGSSSPGGSGGGPSISMTNLRPESMAHNNASKITLDRTPPDSPHFPPARRDASTTSLTPRLPGQRAPSAYLDDLLADETGSLPSSSQVPSSHASRTPGRS